MQTPQFILGLDDELIVDGMCGNAVPPPLGRAVIEANWNSRVELRRAA